MRDARQISVRGVSHGVQRHVLGQTTWFGSTLTARGCALPPVFEHVIAGFRRRRHGPGAVGPVAAECVPTNAAPTPDDGPRWDRLSEQRPELLRQQVPAPLLLDPLPTPLPMRRRSSESPSSVRSGPRPPRPTRPAPPSRSRPRAPRPGTARVAGDHRQARRGGLQVHDAETLHVQAAPPGPARHREHVARPVVGRELRPWNGPVKWTASATPVSWPAGAVPSRRARPRRRAGPRPAPWPGCAHRRDQCVLALRGTSRETQHHGAIREPEAGADPVAARVRAEGLLVDARRQLHHARGRLRRQCGGDSGTRVLTEVGEGVVDSPIRRSRLRAAGSWAHPASWPCVVATSRCAPARRSAGAIRPSGRPPEPHRRASVLPQQSGRAARSPRGGQQHRGPVAYDGELLLGVEGGGRLGALAATLPGGGVDDQPLRIQTQRHIVQERLVPPGRGGKSLVTMRVLCIVVDTTERDVSPYSQLRTAALHRRRTVRREIMVRTTGDMERAGQGLRWTWRAHGGSRSGCSPPGPSADWPCCSSSSRCSSSRPGRHQRRLGDLPRLVRHPAHRRVPARRRDLAIPARRRAGRALPALLPFLDYEQAFYVLAFLADLTVLCYCCTRADGRTGRCAGLGLGGRRRPARPDRVRPLRPDGDGGGGGRAARGRRRPRVMGHWWPWAPC